MRRFARSLAVFGAVVIIAGQLATAIHTHQIFQTQRVGSAAELTIDNGLCALCLLAFHSKATPGPAPTLARPEVQLRAAPEAAASSIESFDQSCAMTRGPPFIA
ncbi:MAG TPA: hypothetical protein VIX59_15410 [Candidatus Binataceae bacterium]